MNELTRHTSNRFNEDLEKIRTLVLGMGGLVEGQVKDSLKALLKGKVENVIKVVEVDDKVNDLEKSIGQQCNSVLVLRHPVASDLRLVVSMIKATADLERMGDEAEKIALFAKTLDDSGSNRKETKILKHMANHVKTMLSDSLNAFAQTDADLARQTILAYHEIDDEFDAIYRQLITRMMEDIRGITCSMHVISCARSLARIGEYSRNVSEYVVFLVEGEDVRHYSAEELSQEK